MHKLKQNTKSGLDKKLHLELVKRPMLQSIPAIPPAPWTILKSRFSPTLLLATAANVQITSKQDSQEYPLVFFSPLCAARNPAAGEFAQRWAAEVGRRA